MGRWRAWLGIGLIVLSAAGLFFWETAGRKTVFTEPVLVAAAEIPQGAVATRGAFAVARIPKENLAAGALSPARAAQLYGRRASQTIPVNQQIVADYFSDRRLLLKENQSVFVLPEEWISMRSSSLRKADRITLYASLSLADLGTYSAVFVKDQNEQEVVSPEGSGGLPEERTNSSAQIAGVEIAATLEQYRAIREAALAEGGLLLVQENGESQTTEAVRKKSGGVESRLFRSGKLRSRVALRGGGAH